MSFYLHFFVSLMCFAMARYNFNRMDAYRDRDNAMAFFFALSGLFCFCAGAVVLVKGAIA